ncbi:unnamed protein product [Ceratitis capitata]|uniref:(Mediterranean fruit fly) hypothetical protein n=1 Tax=Ceratitis capitata TaxID=7213 RepID=A0A811V1R5_CERCA|nr:unnamed protein product [Ceratitis capitata]
MRVAVKKAQSGKQIQQSVYIYTYEYIVFRIAQSIEVPAKPSRILSNQLHTYSYFSGRASLAPDQFVNKLFQLHRNGSDFCWFLPYVPLFQSLPPLQQLAHLFLNQLTFLWKFYALRVASCQEECVSQCGTTPV